MKKLLSRASLLAMLVLMVTSIVSPDLLEQWASERDLSRRLLSPLTDGHLLGTDGLGRDVALRLIIGAKHTVGIAALATLISAAIGIGLGLLSALTSRWIRQTLDRIVDLTIAFPSLVLAVTLVAVLGRSSVTLALALGLFSWPVFARVTTAQTRGILALPYVQTASYFGVSPWRIAFSHVIPVIAPTIGVLIALQFATLLISTAGLSFLGLGPGLGVPEWGSMLAEARAELNRAPWLLIGPGVAIAWTVLAMNSLAEKMASRLRLSHQRDF
ncbi:MAG: ABC transporter permease [Steroidobacteraceae bacterium]